MKNTGNADLKIFALSSSCDCTTAKTNKDLIKPGETAILTVTFDPNLHKESTGKLERIVYLKTNDLENPEKEITVFMEVIK